jgi:uncharacterized sulfatase
MAGFTDGMTTDFGPEAPYVGIRKISGGAGLALGRDGLAPLRDFLDAAGDGPFFVWFAPMLPHEPFDAPQRFSVPYRDLGLDTAARLYFANVTRFDAVVGDLVAALEKRGLLENTLVVMLSDNGWDASAGTNPRLRNVHGGPRGKLSMAELGFRTPIVFHWPRRLAGGRRDAHLVSTVDVVATLLDLAGAEPLPDRPGRSLGPLLTGKGGFERERVFGGMRSQRNESWSTQEPLKKAIRREKAWYVRSTEWRYVWWPDRDAEALYRIARDPHEAHDVAARHPDLAASFRQEILDWVEAMRRPWGPTPKS